MVGEIVMNDELLLAKKIIRRKAKRLQRAESLLYNFKVDIEVSNVIP